MTVRAPDGVRFSADARNEAEGVPSYLAVAWSAGDSGAERAAQLVAALPL